MKCYNCGSDVPEESIFCGMCGAKLESEPETEEPEAAPVVEPEPMEPIIDPVTEPVEPVAEPTEPIDKPVEPVSESDETVIETTQTEQNEGAHAEVFIIKNCPRCGAVLINGAKFCSNCGNSLIVYEQDMNRSRKRGKGVKVAITAILAALVIIFGVRFFMNSYSIEGEWVVENSGGGFFDMFGESYLEFDDDGTAMYYNGLFTLKKYGYSYNRFTKILTLQISAQGGILPDNARLHVEWIDPYTISIRELNMTLHRVEDIPYAYEDDEYNNDDIVQF